MARADKIDSLVHELRLDASKALGEQRARVERVERDHRVEGELQFRRVAADHRRQPREDTRFFRLGFALEHHQPVVQLDRPHRLDEQRLARHAAVLHDSLEALRVIQLHRQHEAPVANRHDIIRDERFHARRVERAQQARFEVGALVAQPAAEPLQLGARVIEEFAIVGQRTEHRVGEFLGREQVVHQRRHMGEALDPRAQKSADVARTDDKVAHFHQRFAAEDRPDARRREQVRPLIAKFANRNRAGVRAQLDHLGGRRQPPLHFCGVDRRAQLGGRLATRIGSAEIHDEVNHLVEFESFQIAFAHR